MEIRLRDALAGKSRKRSAAKKSTVSAPKRTRTSKKVAEANAA